MNNKTPNELPNCKRCIYIDTKPDMNQVMGCVEKILKYTLAFTLTYDFLGKRWMVKFSEDFKDINYITDEKPEIAICKTIQSIISNVKEEQEEKSVFRMRFYIGP